MDLDVAKALCVVSTTHRQDLLFLIRNMAAHH